ncbi:MAG: hypothetical protein ACRBN8_25300 [Nannocystales bacterium]
MTVRAYSTCLLLSLALPVGCGTDEPAPAAEGETDAAATTGAHGSESGSSGAADESSSGAASDVDYYEDVRPLLAQHCVSCHTEGSIAPFRLDTYDEVAGLAAAIKVVVEARTMPPYGVRADGSCQDFDDARWLTDDEIATISAWVDGGMVAGDDTLEAPEPPTLPTLEGETEVVTIPEYEPGTQEDLGFALDDYRCFPIELGLEQDRYLVGYDVLPDNDELVHHVLGFRVDPEFLNNTAAINVLEGLDDKPGWPCYGAAGDGILPQGVPVTWAPGQGALNYPEGVGVRFAPGDLMVVQMHYNLLDEGGGIDASKVRLKWADEVEQEGFQVLWDPFLFQSFGGGGETLEPGMESVKYNWNATFREMFAFDGYDFDSIDVLGVLPHMHEHGRKMAVEFERADGMECAADVDRYDYNWQRTYFYDEPVTVRDTDSLHVECDFDTSAETDPLQAGFGTQDEMCLVGFFFTESQ